METGIPGRSALVTGAASGIGRASRSRWRLRERVWLSRISSARRAMLQSGGSIINMSLVAGLGAAQMLGPYGAAKAGVIQLTQTVACVAERRSG